VDLDFDSGTFRSDGWMSLRWKDARYAWLPSNYGGVTKLNLPFSRVWAPDVVLHNSLGDEKFAYRQIGFVMNTGEFVYLLSVHTRTGCEPRFEGFPFGVQTCALKFGSWVNGAYDVEYRLGGGRDGNGTAVQLEDFFSPSGWRVRKKGMGTLVTLFRCFPPPLAWNLVSIRSFASPRTPWSSSSPSARSGTSTPEREKCPRCVRV